MRALVSLAIVLLLLLVSYIAVDVAGLKYLFGGLIPLAAIVIFIIGFVYRIFYWAKSPVPFRIPTTCGQQKTLSWIKSNNLESPHNKWGVIGRMLLEILFFRSLFRNTEMGIKEGNKLVYGSNKYLWLGGLAFHWSFLIIFIRHFKFFAEPVPEWVMYVQNIDSFFQVGLPIIFLTDIVILGALTFLFVRRILEPKLRYISLAGDYFPLFLLFGIVITGILMRYFYKVDIVGIKEMAMGWLTFSPRVVDSVGTMFYLHLFLVSSLFIYFPFSKLMHMGGVFMSPTRNMINNNRAERHVNPWDYPVKLHTYEEYEDEFREVMKAADMPLEKE